MTAEVLMPEFTAAQFPRPASGPMTRQPATRPISDATNEKYPNWVPSGMCGLKISAVKKAKTAKANPAKSLAAVGTRLLASIP